MKNWGKSEENIRESSKRKLKTSLSESQSYKKKGGEKSFLRKLGKNKDKVTGPLTEMNENNFHESTRRRVQEEDKKSITAGRRIVR